MSQIRNPGLPMRAFNRLRRELRRAAVFILRVDPWHAGIPFDREYPADIIRHLNAREPAGRGSAIEIGCGLGDIIGHLRFDSKTGYDAVPRTLRAASVFAALFGTGTASFKTLNFPEQSPGGRHDAIILVNWIHEVPPEELRRGISRLYNEHLNPGGELILDTVADKEYRHNHSIRFLTDTLGCGIAEIGSYARERTVYALQKPCGQAETASHHPSIGGQA